MKFYPLVKKYILEASDKYETDACNVTSSQFWSVAKDIKEWEIRKLGGFTNLRDTLFPSKNANKIQPRKKNTKFKLQKKVIQNFQVHEVNIQELFKAAKLSKDQVLKIVVQPDTHCPEEDKDAINTFCSFLDYYKPHGLINIGDFMEMEPVSHWQNGGLKPRRMSEDAKAGNLLLDKIGKSAGPQCIFKRFLIGNHEDWLQQYLTSRIPEVLDGLEEFGLDLKIENLLHLKDLGYRVIPLNEILKVGHAHFIHGFYTGNSHAKKHLDVFGVNIYYGHLHDVQSYSGVSVNGTHEAMSLGCLRGLNAPFLKGKPNNWVHAFGIFEFRYDGSYTRIVPIIVDGEFSYNGKIFKG